MKVLKETKTKNGKKIQLLGSNFPSASGRGQQSEPQFPSTSGRGARGEGKVLVIGVFHGDEPQGKYLIEKYIEKNPESPLLFIPCLNPDGMAANTRTNANGVDLNRNFPADNWEWTEKNEFYGGENPASEMETRFVMEVIDEYSPKLIITLHAPFCVVNFDGNAKNIAKEISKIIGYPVEENIGYPTPGSFGTYAGIENGIPTITLELDEKCEVEDLIAPVHKIFNLISR